MTKSGTVVILVIVACILVTGCVVISTKNETLPQTPFPPTYPPSSDNSTPVPLTTVTTLRAIPPGVPFGKLNISIGNYNARLPVFVDNASAGQVSAGKVLNLDVIEGNHTIRICSGSFCVNTVVFVYSSITTTINFEERLNRDLPMGSLNVSIGDYNARVPVYIDDIEAGNVSQGQPLIQRIGAGNHSVKICIVEDCFTEDAEVKSPNQTTVDFESRLKREGRTADLVVSIGGYNAQRLSVFLDNSSAGLVSQGSPLTLNVNTGFHEVKVCAGIVCPKEQVEVKFGKQNFIDFEKQLMKDAKFLEPTVRIIDYSLSGTTLIIHAEFINPGNTDLYMTPTFSAVYSYIPYGDGHPRTSSSVKGEVREYVTAGTSMTDTVYLYLSEGDPSTFLLSVPVILTVKIN